MVLKLKLNDIYCSYFINLSGVINGSQNKRVVVLLFDYNRTKIKSKTYTRGIKLLH